LLPAATKRAHPDVSEAPTTAMLRGAKNSRSRPGATSGASCGDGIPDQPATFGSFGSPRPRSPMMLRWISLVPE
jgi:hypothetical protein